MSMETSLVNHKIFLLALIVIVATMGGQFVSALSTDDILAVPDLGRYANGECINLIQICSNCTYNNITSVLVAPGSIFTLSSTTQMTKSGTRYNHQFCNTTLNGQYTVSGVGDLDGNPAVWSYTLTVGGSLMLFLTIALVGLVLLCISFFMNNEYLGFIAGSLFIVSGVYALINGLAEIADDYTRMLSITIIGIGLMFNVAVGYQLYSESKGDD